MNRKTSHYQCSFGCQSASQSSHPRLVFALCVNKFAYIRKLEKEGGERPHRLSAHKILGKKC